MNSLNEFKQRNDKIRLLICKKITLAGFRGNKTGNGKQQILKLSWQEMTSACLRQWQERLYLCRCNEGRGRKKRLFSVPRLLAKPFAKQGITRVKRDL